MEQKAAIFKVLSEPTRLRLAVLLLSRGEVCVCQLAQALDLPEYQISRHLSIMLKASLVQKRRQGTWIYYKFNQAQNKFEQKLWACLKNCFDEDQLHLDDIDRLKKANCDK